MTVCLLLNCDSKLSWRLVNLTKSADTHKQGRSVTFVDFSAENQAIFSVIYKPRSNDIDHAFDQLVSWINASLSLPLLTPRYVREKNYAWFEVISHASCAAEIEVHAYYQRLGYLLGLMYLLCGSDIHFENVIGHG